VANAPRAEKSTRAAPFCVTCPCSKFIPLGVQARPSFAELMPAIAAARAFVSFSRILSFSSRPPSGARAGSVGSSHPRRRAVARNHHILLSQLHACVGRGYAPVRLSRPAPTLTKPLRAKFTVIFPPSAWLTPRARHPSGQKTTPNPKTTNSLLA